MSSQRKRGSTIRITLRPHPRNFAGTRGAMMCDAAIMCLDSLGHKGAGTPLQIAGPLTKPAVLRWRPIPAVVRRLFQDPRESTEHGAYGIALLTIRKLHPGCEVERSRSGTGFDWRLTLSRGDTTIPFAGRTIRLEVTGTMNPDESIAARLTKKRKQLLAGASSGNDCHR